MAMNKINGPQMGQPRSLERFQETGKGKATTDEKRVGGESPGSGASSSAADSVQISAKAREMMELRQVYEAGQQALTEVDDSRPQKLAEVRQRLEQGFYHSAQVRDEVAAKLQRVLGGLDEV